MLKKFIRDESGQGLSEYLLLVALIALAVIGAAFLFGDKIVALFTKATNCLDSVIGSNPNCP